MNQAWTVELDIPNIHSHQRLLEDDVMESLVGPPLEDPDNSYDYHQVGV